MQMSYTGSQNEAAETAQAALQNELAARAATPQLSTIRDHTGSGIGNNPDDNARRARVSRQHLCVDLCSVPSPQWNVFMHPCSAWHAIGWPTQMSSDALGSRRVHKDVLHVCLEVL